MKRNEIVPLGNLRTGDRFYFQGDKKKTAYQTTGIVLQKPYVAYTEFPNAKQPERWQLSATGYKMVVFLRHTAPQPGEECGIEDLKAGDVFTLLANIVTEYRVREQYKDEACPAGECKAVKLDGSKDIVFIPHGATVLFIRKEGEVVS